ncbi:toprim domain-containing protein [Bacteroides hominis]|uniref:toprim domain-containing protein n=1 Tax=Bacteroides hominis TaxID=2763023 RepID=UPI00164C469B|nr:toprim domain-containing protein [Bacteroides hominis (ex Liu et al. 2022)]MBC5614591.1 toprim domain-containing protein [Bacteroides hominis (ex Liu et al. 2022)]
MRDGELTYDDFLQRLNIQDVLIDAGYHLNRRDGLRYPSYVRLDNERQRIRGDKFIVTQQGKCCFQAQQQKVYNIISFIKEHPQFFAEYHAGISPDRLVNLVCNRLLNHPIAERETRIIQPKRDVKPFDIADYDLHKFNPQDRETQKKFYPFFKHRGIDLYTQYAFHKDFCLATKHRADGLTYTNLAFPLTLPKDTGEIVGFEERGRPRMDGNSSYKGKAEGSNSSEGLWIASPARTSLSAAKHIYWFESSYDAMAYYQLHQRENKDLKKAVFVSTGGTPTEKQMRGVLSLTLPARQHICFDTDLAGIEFTKNLQKEIYRAVRSTIESTPEGKPYLETVPDGENLDSGEVVLLPKALLASYGKYEAAWEEAMSMRSSGLCHPDDIQDQVDIMNGHYREFREGLRELLGLDKANDASFVREQPNYPNKDWNEQLLAEQKREESVDEDQVREKESEQEQQARFRR